ncbi:putative ubiquitin carboxyl-terminal hydrolase 3 [Pseudocercospora fuligena]|uniref:Ubiquitin carboxyl-terminal hydrolase n=1 Tax=Pseudocercospora fuligena TaxID=685502 RepID=A0A8H6VCV5_9PEZI|nr:putative ubiquitin carboxyl-terminal hydrolase 3 [Pseudocercospora fuligena]
MQHQYQGGPGPNIPPALPLHPQQRRDYHGYHHGPQSPMPPQHYYGYNPQYYGHPPPQPYQWRQPYPPQQYLPPQHMQPPYQRSPMVVTSQPHLQQPMTPVTRQQNPLPAPPQTTQSPRPVQQYSHQQPPAATPSPAPTPSASLPPVPAAAASPKERMDTPPPPPSRRQSTAQNPLLLPPEHKQPYWPDLPWYSVPESRTAFPTRATPRRRRRRNIRPQNDSVALPALESSEDKAPAQKDEASAQADSQTLSNEGPASEASTIAAPSEPETPATSQAPSESEFTTASTPATPAQAPTASPKPTPTQQAHTRRDTRTAIAVPSIPGLSKPKEAAPPTTSSKDVSEKAAEDTTPKAEAQQATSGNEEAASAAEEDPKTPPPKPAPAPKSWADLVKRNTKTQAPAAKVNGEVITNGFQLPKTASLAEALKQYRVQGGGALNFLEPRGLVNTGNMCYMNSILQVLVFCVPFYNFLDQVRQRTVHSMKSDTPLVDAMIMFMREFKVLASAESVDVLRSLLRQEQLEQYGDPVTPDYVYEVIRKLPRFASMRRGHQQDAEEFLGFLLEGLHDECVQVMQGQPDEQPSQSVSSPDTVMSPGSADGWLEVGPKQKASVTRTAGQQDAPSPITKIFGGHLRSELRVPGLKDSVTLEPYKPLQLDIGASHVNNIVDALKGITYTEALIGDFGGKGTTAKKQVFIDSLPPVLVLHLKRFQYDNSFSGTQKIWKKVGYPLELQIPKEVFPPAKRAQLQISGLPKFRLTSVVYHHGKSAAGGHYTVDVLRQDSREWIRMDDTIIRRIRPEDVAEGGAEEDPKILAKALEQHKADQDLQKQRNMYQGLDEAEKEPEEEKPWSEVNGHPSGHKKNWSNVAANVTNGTSTPTSTTGKRTPTAKKEGVRDNKVAYILLYERIHD